MRSGSTSRNPARSIALISAFALASAVGSALLFAVQPMVAKAHLPTLGGSPAVWILCSAFFQASLLAGYSYAHATRRLSVTGQAAIQVSLLAVGLWFAVGMVQSATETGPSPGSDPSTWLIGRLIVTVALPFVVASATAPMLQRWFSKTGHRSALDPYFLYGASNLGGLMALLTYPIVIEPNFSLSGQSRLWSLGYGALIALTIACALFANRVGPEKNASSTGPVPRLTWLRWASLAFVPSSLLLGVTTYLTTDVAAVPLFWVVPLAMYLITFVIAFSRRPILPANLAARVLPWSVVLLAPALAIGLVQAFWIPVHLLVFATATMLCHGELARQRPDPDRLSSFYLAISIGGVLGGVFNAMIAPRIFDRLAEYPLAIVLSCLALPGVGVEFHRLIGRPRGLFLPILLLALAAPLAANLGDSGNSALGMIGVVAACGIATLIAAEHRTRPLRFALGLGAVLIAGGLAPGLDGRTLLRERSFFGTLRVTQHDGLGFRRLFHGSTLHGLQAIDPIRRLEPLSYYDRSGPIGEVFDILDSRPSRPVRRVAVAGLGIGSVAAYAKRGQDWTFYELDPDIARVAADPRYFSYLDDARAHARSVEVLLGDARLMFQESPDAAHDLILLDAFSSDAVPVHLLTREALTLYRKKLAPGGWIVFNITNRYVDLEPVLGTLAAEAKMTSRVRADVVVSRDSIKAGKQPSIWVLLTATEADLGKLSTDPRWFRTRTRSNNKPAWSDDFSDVAGCLILNPRQWWSR